MADYARSHSTRVLFRSLANLFSSIVIVSTREEDSCKVVGKLAGMESLMKGKNDWFDLFYEPLRATTSLLDSVHMVEPIFHAYARSFFIPLSSRCIINFHAYEGRKKSFGKPSLHSDASSKNKGTKRYWIKDTISIKKVRRSIKIHSRTVPKKGSDRKGRERDLLGLREGADRGGVLFREKRISMSE